jgi:hypothetical protein
VSPSQAAWLQYSKILGLQMELSPEPGVQLPLAYLEPDEVQVKVSLIVDHGGNELSFARSDWN